MTRVAQRRGRLAVMGGGAVALMAAVTAVTWAAAIPGQLPGLAAIGAGNTGTEAAIGSAAGALPDRDRGVSHGSSSHDLVSEAAPAAVPIASTGNGAAALAALGDRPRVFAVASRPDGAVVYLNGERLPETSPVNVSLRAGERYTIRLERDGYEASGWRFTLADLSDDHFRSGQLYFPLAPAAPPTPPADEQLLTASAQTIANSDSTVDAPADDIDGGTSLRARYGGGPPPSPEEIRRIRVPGEAPAPQKLRHVDPEVPAQAATGGVVVLEIEVSSRGNVVQAKVLRGLDPVSNQAALDAVVRWKYQPTQLAGVPVHVLMTVTLPMSGSR